MQLKDIALLPSYNPWWGSPGSGFDNLPTFRREAFVEVYQDVRELPQIVSVTGPRRVGKSTLLRQIIRKLIEVEGPAQAERIAYFSMDDPALHLPGADPNKFFNDLVQSAAGMAKAGRVYLFLDEIHRFDRWELYLKKFYDLKSPVRFVVSGSASTPIFKKSRESLLGRLKSHRLLPFSFREWFFYNAISDNHANPEAADVLRRVYEESKDIGDFARGQLNAGALVDVLNRTDLVRAPGALVKHTFEDYCYEGGFPETWPLTNPVARQEYLYQNQVERVIFEDLLLAAEFRKPEMLRRFYLGLLADPGRETNLSKLSSQIELGARTIESYFPLLEATDLVWRLHKFTGSKASAKAGNFKTYLVDLAVRNAVMKLTPEALKADSTALGYYAENVVANHVRRWPGLVEVGYFRERGDEIDFIIDLGSERIAIEVKYQNVFDERDIIRAHRVAQRVKCDALILVAKSPPVEEVVTRLAKRLKFPISAMPLHGFLLLF